MTDTENQPDKIRWLEQRIDACIQAIDERQNQIEALRRTIANYQEQLMAERYAAFNAEYGLSLCEGAGILITRAILEHLVFSRDNLQYGQICYIATVDANGWTIAETPDLTWWHHDIPASLIADARRAYLNREGEKDT